MIGMVPRRVLPVLMYHRIGESPAGADARLWISAETFARHLSWLKRAGVRTLSLDEAYQHWCSGRTPRRAVLLTFDDAFAETLELAAAALRRAGLRAAVFVPAGLIGRPADLGPIAAGVTAASAARIVGPDGLRRWVELGFDVGSHSLTHRDLRGLEHQLVRQEVRESKRRLEELLERPVEDFCYPYAHHDELARREVAAAGYRAAYAGEPPIVERFALPRMMVYPDDSPGRYRRKLSGHYYWLSAWHQRLLAFVRH